MNFLERLREQDPSSAVAYHLEGLLEAQETIRRVVEELAGVYEKDLEATAGKLTELQGEIYFHQVYHMKELRRPLRELVDAAYAVIPDIDPEAEVDWEDLQKG